MRPTVTVNLSDLQRERLDIIPDAARRAYWAYLHAHAHAVVLDVRFFIWHRVIRLRDLFPLFARVIPQPLHAPPLADSAVRG